MPRMATIVGGPRDGMLVPVSGSHRFEPGPIRAYYQLLDLPPLPPPLECHRQLVYTLKHDIDGQLHYVLSEPHHPV